MPCRLASMFWTERLLVPLMGVLFSYTSLTCPSQIDPKRAIPRDEYLRNTQYFVGGLSHTTTAETTREFFFAHGKVVDATVMVDRETGRSKGFGFVTFEDSSDQERSVGKLGLVLDDKEVRCSSSLFPTTYYPSTQIEVKAARLRSQRDQARTTGGRDGFGEQEIRTSSPGSMPFNAPQATNPAAFMVYQRMMNQMPMAVGAAAGHMGMMNPMMMGMGGGMNMGAAGMGMGMGNFGGMGMGGWEWEWAICWVPMPMRVACRGWDLPGCRHAATFVPSLRSVRVTLISSFGHFDCRLFAICCTIIYPALFL